MRGYVERLTSQALVRILLQPVHESVVITLIPHVGRSEMICELLITSSFPQPKQGSSARSRMNECQNSCNNWYTFRPRTLDRTTVLDTSFSVRHPASPVRTASLARSQLWSSRRTRVHRSSLACAGQIARLRRPRSNRPSVWVYRLRVAEVQMPPWISVVQPAEITCCAMQGRIGQSCLRDY